MKKIFCDLCGKEMGDEVTSDSKFELKVGALIYPDVCAKCYKEIYEFVETLIKT